jgi:excisionase family DNA binding protein
MRDTNAVLEDICSVLKDIRTALKRQTPANRFYNTATAAKELGVNNDTVRRWIRDGKLAAIKVGSSKQSQYKISSAAIDQVAAA